MDYAIIRDYIRTLYPTADFSKLLIQPYAYRFAITADIAAGASPAPGQLLIAANADFVLLSPRYRCSVKPAGTDANADIVPKLRVQITDTGSNQPFFNEAVDISTYFGQIGKAEYFQQYPRLINGNSGLTIQVTSYASVDVYNPLELTFAGILVRGLGS